MKKVLVESSNEATGFVTNETIAAMQMVASWRDVPLTALHVVQTQSLVGRRW